MFVTQSAMIARLNISIFGVGGKDKIASSSVKANFNTTKREPGYYHKYRIDKKALKDITQAAGAARDYHREKTAAWGDTGTSERLLPAKLFLDYTQAMSEFKIAFMLAADDFIRIWPELVKKAEEELGDLFVEEEYIGIDKLKDEFDFKAKVYPIPQSDDFRVNLSETQLADIKAELDKDNQDKNTAMLEGLFRRIYDPVQRMAATLADEDKVFHKSLIENIQMMANILPDLNVLDNPDLQTIVDEVQARLCEFEPVDLRKHPEIRKEAAKEAASVASNMEAFLGNA